MRNLNDIKINLSLIANDIPLETTKESIIADIMDIKFKDHYILVKDDLHQLLLFNEEGKFLKRIGSSTVDKKDELLSQKLIDLNGDTLFLNDILKEKSLIFRYSILNCNSCIDSVFYYIHENEKFLGNTKILIFTYFTDLRHFIVTARLNQIKYEIFLIPENKLNIRQDNPYIPFFFLINETPMISF